MIVYGWTCCDVCRGVHKTRARTWWHWFWLRVRWRLHGLVLWATGAPHVVAAPGGAR
jgi:hypothetical protein